MLLPDRFALILGLLLMVGPALIAEDAAPVPIAQFGGKHEQAFKNALLGTGAKRDKARGEVAAWGPLTTKAADQLRKLVVTKWPVTTAPAGWKGKPAKNGGLREIDVPGLGKREYYLAIPEGYTPGRNWPLALSLHGAGGEGKGDYAWCWEKWAKLWPGLIACLSGQPAEAQWFPEQRPFLTAVLDDVRRNFAIDDDRIALHGFSNGGNGAWYYGIHWPSQWSAVFTRGGACPEPEEMLVNLLHVPYTVVHGTGDSVIPCERDRKTAAALQKLGYEVVFKEMPGDHTPFHEQMNPEVIPWLAKQKRDPYPKRVLLRSNAEADHRAYWIDCPKRQGRMLDLEARVDGQTIALTVKGCAALTLWLADPLVDLDQPVTVTWNGKQVHAGAVPRRGADLVAWLDATFDRAAAPVARLEITAE